MRCRSAANRDPQLAACIGDPQLAACIGDPLGTLPIASALADACPGSIRESVPSNSFVTHMVLPQHPHQDRPERSILLAVDQELGESAALRVGPELADPLGALEVGSIRT
jgi:hypothetical protein